MWVRGRTDAAAILQFFFLFFKKYAFLGIFTSKFLLKNILNVLMRPQCLHLPPATTLAIIAEFYFNRVSTVKVYIG